MTIASKLAEIQAAEGELATANTDPLTRIIFANILRALLLDVMVSDDPTTPADETVHTFELGSFRLFPIGQDRAALFGHLMLPVAGGSSRRSYTFAIVPESSS